MYVVHVTSIKPSIYTLYHKNDILFVSTNIEGISFDGIPITTVMVYPVPMIAVFDFLATVGVIFTVICLLFNFRFRKKRYVLAYMSLYI